MIELAVWAMGLRVVQALAAAAPTIIIGLIICGVLARLLGHAGTRRLFGEGQRTALLQAWFIGMLLPVCSLGVIPICRQMVRSGVSGGTILAFAITAPLFNPLSLLYGLTLAEPFTILAFAFCSLIVVTGVGALWDRLFPGSARPEPEPRPLGYGLTRMLGMGTAGARELGGPSLVYLTIGLVGVGLLAVVLPAGSLQTSAEADDPFAPLIMAAIAIPAYATPLQTMSQLGSMFLHGNSVGAAFTLLALGAGLNLGLLVWAFHTYGLRRGATLLALLVGIVLALAYGVDRPLYPASVHPAGHTHAFDGYCNPFPEGTQQPARIALAQLRDHVNLADWGALGLLLAVVLVGAILQRTDPNSTLEARWERPESQPDATPSDGPWYNRPLPGPVLGAATLLILVGISIAGCFAYYPPTDEAFKEMDILRTEMLAGVLTNDPEVAEYYIPRFEDWTRRVQVGHYLRTGQLTPYQQVKARVLRDKLELLEHALAGESTDNAKSLGWEVDRSYRRMKQAYLPQ